MSESRGAAALSRVRDGSWVTRSRLSGYSVIILAICGLCFGWLLLTADGLTDYDGRPIGTDFSNVWAAGQLVLRGEPAVPYDPERHFAEQQRIFDDPKIPFFGWHYPPMFLMVAALLALVPYLPALFLWQGTLFILYLFTIQRIAKSGVAILLAGAFPAVFVNVTHGHNGFLTATLFGGGLYLLRSRPYIAGLLFGLLAYKPHLGALIPFALAAGGYWRAFGAATVTVLGMSALTAAIFGIQTWQAFFESLSFTSTFALEAGTTGWHKIQSAFSSVRMLDGSVDLAYAVQGVFTLASVAAVIYLWRWSRDYYLKSAGLMIATLLTTPYLLDYDLMLLAPAIAFLAVRGMEREFLPYELSILAFAWVAPLISRPIAIVLPISVGFIAVVLLMAVVLAHAARTPVASSPPRPAHG